MNEALTNGETIREAIDLWDNWVNPLDAYRDPVNGEFWLPIAGNLGGEKNRPALDRSGFATDLELEMARNHCRVLAERNEYVICAIENRQNYVIGEQHTYKVVAKADIDAPKADIRATQKLIDEWVYYCKWGTRQREIVRRKDRDGEAFLRFFEDEDSVYVRFVEPWQVKPPDDNRDDKFGIKTDPDDVETVLGYWIDGKEVDADEIQHRKANVDCNVRRGMPTFWPVRRTLAQIDELLIYLAYLAKARAKYTVVRKLEGATLGQASTFVAGKADYTITDPTTGKARRFEPSRPGEVHTVNTKVSYEFPSSNIGGVDYQIIIKLLLQSVASRLNMPIWMLTSDVGDMAAYTASNTAESPSTKNFQTLQAIQRDDDLEVLWRVVQHGAENGRLRKDIEELVEIQVGPPEVQTRDKLKDAQIRQADMAAGILSAQTASTEAGYDYDQEQTNIEQHQVKTGGTTASPVDLLGIGGGNAYQPG